MNFHRANKNQIGNVWYFVEIDKNTAICMDIIEGLSDLVITYLHSAPSFIHPRSNE